MAKFIVDEGAEDGDPLVKQGEFIRNMEDGAIVDDVVQGLREARRGSLATESIIDILNEA